MGLRLRKSIKIMPGLKINLSKSGASLTVGKAGACVNVSKRGTRTTVGLPGTGISYSAQVGTDTSTRRAPYGTAAMPIATLPEQRLYTPVTRLGKFGIWLLWAALLSPISQKGDGYGAFSMVASIVLAVVTVKLINKKRANRF